MNSITITLSEERFNQLQQVAARYGISPADLIRISIEELLARPEEDFPQAVDHVLRKNADLYRRLA